MKTISEVIKTLQVMEESYGDLPVTISIDFKKSKLKTILESEEDNVVISSDDLYFGYDQFKDKSDEINIRSFPY